MSPEVILSDSMARRKGKSLRRIKDWHRRFQVGEGGDSPEVTSRQKVSRRAVKLPPERLEAPAENLEYLPKTEGMVLGLFPGGALVGAQERRLLCGIAKTFRAPEGASALAVGDNVTVALVKAEHSDQAAAEDKDRADGMIIARQPRESLLARPQPRSGKRRGAYDDDLFLKVVVANMDALLIVTATRQPPLREGLIDRFLIIAERGELQPFVVINKIDLAEPDQDMLDELEGLEVQTICCSAPRGDGLEELARLLTGRRSILAGASGVGKTTLINALIPGTEAATQSVRLTDERGRHTTAASVVYDLPGGGLIADTPGVRELGIDLKATELPWYFPEFDAYAGKCRFNDCTHTCEPDCAVLAGVESGEISPRRFGSYLRILDSLNENRT